MINRRKAREYAFILLFEYKFQPNDITELLADFLAEHDAGSQEAYIKEVVEGVVLHAEELDGMIAEYAKGWSPERISAVCLAAMRLALYEMKYIPDIPLNVSVNEAIAIVKEYSGEESVDFVNGILGNLKEQC